MARTTALALLVAALLLVTIVVPAEYGVDPLRTGRVLGLTRMSRPAPSPPEPPAPTGTRPQAPSPLGPISYYPAAYRSDSTQFVLGPYEFVEYKYHLDKGATMSFAWTGGTELVHDFHGDPDEGGAEAAVSYDKANRRGANGMFAAPFSGIHGWYWENPGSETVTVSLTSAGFYTSALEFRSDRTRRRHELKVVDAGDAVSK